MIVSHKHRFIFVKTHKTAGSSLETALGRECADDDIVSHMEDNIATGIPRNYGPTSGLGSSYKRHKLLRKMVSRHSSLLGEYYYEHMPAWRIRELVGSDIWESYFTFCFERNAWDKTVSYYLWKKHGQGRAMPSFEDYITRKAHRLPVDSPLYCNNEGVMVDRVFEFRNISAALQELRERLELNLPEPLPREKTGVATERKHYSEYYNPQSRKHIARLFHREIEIMGYRFDGDV
ncbi:MAG: hypothetical protein AB8B57_12500 [Congregibacter sp.]